jgi:predicted dinucleotide-binding enzyme
MSYAIIGTGNIGAALAQLFARADIGVSIANTRGPSSIQLPGRAVTLKEALDADIIFMAIPLPAVEQFSTSLPDWTGKIVVDTTNAHYTPDAEMLLQGRLSAHYAAEQLPGATVVKAFNQLPANVLSAELDPALGRRVVFIATDHPAAGDRIAALAGNLGFAAVQLGRIDEGGRLIQAPNALVLRHLVERPMFED